MRPPLAAIRHLLLVHLAIMERAAHLGTILLEMLAYLQAALVTTHFLIQAVAAVHLAIIPPALVVLPLLPHHVGHSLMVVVHAHRVTIPLEKAA